MRTADPVRCATLYRAAFPKYQPLAATDDWLTGTWAIGACYKNDNRLYGAYPRGYLERVHSMFPQARRVLHAFSGGLTVEAARAAAGEVDPGGPNDLCPRCRTDHGRGSCIEVVLVDMHGPEQGRFPNCQIDLIEFCEMRETAGRFDLILADPPYSAEDAVKYDCPAPNRGAITAALRKVAKPGGHLVWLDQVWPMHRKTDWQCWGQIGLVRSTNHRVRLVSIFEAV